VKAPFGFLPREVEGLETLCNPFSQPFFGFHGTFQGFPGRESQETLHSPAFPRHSLEGPGRFCRIRK
jgi:hypothetical protein